MGVEDRWTRPKGTVDSRGRPEREHTPRWGIGQRWVATWTENGSRKTRSFEFKAQALAHIADVAKAKRDGVHINSHKTTVGEYGDDWIKAQIHQRASSAEQMEIRWRLHIRPVLGHLGLRETQRQHIQSAVLRWSEPPHELAPSTISVTYGYVAALFKSAMQDRLIPVTPCININLPRVAHERVIPLTTAQVLTIADRINPRYRSLVLLGAATGMRSGELRGLTVDRLAWGDPVAIRIDRQLTNTQPVWGPTKTSKSDRFLTVDDTAAGLLAYHMLRWPPHESGLIFTGRENGPLARTSIATAWNSATEGMALPDRSGLHALRHYHASLLIAAGISVTAVADRLGHQDSTETLKTYAHLWPNDEERSRDAIAAGLWA
jgi:integrase